jgi:phenylalanyl-tRNA synthetase beta chain
MKIPLKWLEEYVPLTVPVADLAERLTLAGLEVSGVRLYGLPAPPGLRVKHEESGPVWDRDKIVIAQVLEVDRHPDADKLKLPKVDYGHGRQKLLVTGAPNIHVGDRGQKVILALAGSVLFDGHATPKRLSQLRPTKIRGVPSDAMVCSSFELGIDEEHEGIILLEPEAPVGVPVADYLGDVVLELDITPNMARCLSLVGVAREVAALTGQTLVLPPHTVEASGPSIVGRATVAIADSRLAPRYAAALIEGVKIGPAPGWMQRRLTYAGMRPINNIVDITNYVMLEWGQPLHAFDYDALKRRAAGLPPAIVVRPAAEGEVLRTLDGVERKLTPEMPVIADSAGPIALAGVMGGAETEVSNGTTNVLLESANFDSLTIRRTVRSLELPSEASTRFSRGIHPELVRPALARAAELMRLHAGVPGTVSVADGVVDVYPAPLAPRVIDLPLAEVRRILGVGLSREECARLLGALEFQVTATGPDVLRVVAPPHRLDIQEGPADLIEDLARLHGYDRLPATLLSDQLPAQETNEAVAFEERVRDRLVCAGLQEVITYSLTTPERDAPLHPPPAGYVTLRNPVSAERTVMRHSLLASVLEVAAANLRRAEEVRLFEIGSIYLQGEEKQLPDEPRRLALVLSGRRGQESWADGGKGQAPALDFFDLKGVVEALLADLHITSGRQADAGYRPVQPPALHPGKAAELVVGGKALGFLGELHPRVAQAFEVDRNTPRAAPVSVLVAELDLDGLRAAVPARHAYTPIGEFPAALRDIAVIVEEAVPAERVHTEIRAGGGDLLRDARLFDLYRGESIPAGHKSLAYALTYRADDRTLTDKEVDKAHKRIEDRLRHVLGAQIRGSEG